MESLSVGGSGSDNGSPGGRDKPKPKSKRENLSAGGVAEVPMALKNFFWKVDKKSPHFCGPWWGCCYSFGVTEIVILCLFSTRVILPALVTK